LQHKEPSDFVIATGQQKTVRQFVEKVCALLEIDIHWEGDGLNETGVDNNSGKVLIKVDSAYFRPTEVDNLLGDASKAKRLLGWEHATSFDSLVKEMVEHDMRLSSLESSNKTLELN
jgi:GDPmannose 4,6-dehydratase